MAGATGLRVATYNIHGGVGIDGRRDIGRIADVIAEIDPDVIALQEVEARPGCSPVDQADVLAGRLGMNLVKGPLLFDEGGWYGNAVLSRLPIEGVRRWCFDADSGETRGTLAVRVRDGAGEPWQVLGTHLDLRAGHRLRQVEALRRCLRAPLVLLGDLNEWRPWSRVVSTLRQLGETPPVPASFPSPLPLIRLNRLVLRDCRLEGSPRRHISRQSRWASDHLPLVATVRRDPGAAGPERPAADPVAAGAEASTTDSVQQGR